MRLVNFRFLLRPRKIINILVILITAIVIVNLVLISFNEKHRQSRRILSRAEDPRIYTKLQTNISCPSKIRLLILVSSNLGHSDRRTLIRNTWGPDNSLKDRWRTVFLLTGNDNKREHEISQKENKLYGDIITGDYQESFFNMAFKVAMGFEWSLKFCDFDFLLKTDDDIFVNTHGLLEYLDKNSTLKTKLYTGNPMFGSPVLRGGRYAVKYASGEKRDDATNKTVFAPYCSGGGFLLSKDVVASILNLYDLEHPLNIDDAYIGELAERAEVKPLVNNKNFLMYEDSCRYKPQAFVQHPAKNVCLRELYRQHVKYLLTGELETPKPTKTPTKPPTKAPTQPPTKPKTNPPTQPLTKPTAKPFTRPLVKVTGQTPGINQKDNVISKDKPRDSTPQVQPKMSPQVEIPRNNPTLDQKSGVNVKENSQHQSPGKVVVETPKDGSNPTQKVSVEVTKPNPVPLPDHMQQTTKVHNQSPAPKEASIPGTNRPSLSKNTNAS